MWERNLQDLIRGLRAHKSDESKFIASAIDDIRQEIKGKDMELKAAAVLKLTYVRPCKCDAFESRLMYDSRTARNVGI